MHDKLYFFENFDLDVNGPSMSVIIWGLYIGILAGVVFSIICRYYSGRIVRTLRRAEAVDAATAQTLPALGLGGFMYRRMLRTGTPLRRSVLCANPPAGEPKAGGLKTFWYKKFLRDELPPQDDFATAAFYLPEENRIRAETRFQEEHHPVLDFLLAAVLLTGAALLAEFAIPELLQMLDNFLTQVKPGSNIL